jgi:hypothetical protein
LPKIEVIEEESVDVAREDDNLNSNVILELMEDLVQSCHGLRNDHIHGRIREGDGGDLRRWFFENDGAFLAHVALLRLLQSG